MRLLAEVLEKSYNRKEIDFNSEKRIHVVKFYVLLYHVKKKLLCKFSLHKYIFYLTLISKFIFHSLLLKRDGEHLAQPRKEKVHYFPQFSYKYNTNTHTHMTVKGQFNTFWT